MISLGMKFKKFALGEESAVRSFDTLSESLPALLADEVRTMASEQVNASWTRLEKEYEVQKLVWESVSVSRKRQVLQAITALQEQLEAVIALHPSDRAGALLRLQEILQLGSVRYCSTSMEETIMNIPKQAHLTEARDVLADKLDAAVDPATLPQTDAEKSDLEKFVVSCHLERPLDIKVRSLLELPPPPEETVPAKPKLKARADDDVVPLVIGTPSRTLNEIVGLEPAGPRGSNTSNFSSSSRALRDGGTLGTAVGSKPISSTRSLRSNNSTLAERYIELSMVKPHSAAYIAKRLRHMSSSNAPAAWKQLKLEFETQQLIWESLALTRGKDKDIQGKIDGLKKCIERVFDLHAESYEGALVALEELLERNPDVNVFNKTLHDKAKDVIKQHSLMPLLQQLAERVDVSGTPATLPQTDEDRKELEDLLAACSLDDKLLEYSARLLLLLTIPEELQQKVGPLTMKKAGSFGQGVGINKRSAMVGSKLSRKESNKSAISAEGQAAMADKKDSALRTGIGGWSLGAVAIEGPRVVEAI